MPKRTASWLSPGQTYSSVPGPGSPHQSTRTYSSMLSMLKAWTEEPPASSSMRMQLAHAMLLLSHLVLLVIRCAGRLLQHELADV